MGVYNVYGCLEQFSNMIEEVSIEPGRLRAFRRGLRLTQGELAEKLGLTRETYKNYEYGTPMPPELEAKLYTLGNFADISATNIPTPFVLVGIPYIGGVNASTPMNWTSLSDISETLEVPPKMAGKDRFACRVETDSCYDTLWPADRAVFQIDHTARLNSIVLFRSSENNEVTIKQLKHDGRDFFLHPLNPKYEDVYTPGVVIGYLVGIIRQDGDEEITRYNAGGIHPR